MNDVIKRVKLCEHNFHNAEYELEKATLALIEQIQEKNDYGVVNFTEESGYPKFYDSTVDEVVEFELCKVRGGELYVKNLRYDDDDWYCPYDYGKIDYIDLISYLLNLVPDEEKQ